MAINISKTQKCFQCGEFCIDLNQICDGKIDCPNDGEDEKHCSDLANDTFVTSKYYIYNLNPKYIEMCLFFNQNNDNECILFSQICYAHQGLFLVDLNVYPYLSFVMVFKIV